LPWDRNSKVMPLTSISSTSSGISNSPGYRYSLTNDSPLAIPPLSGCPNRNHERVSYDFPIFIYCPGGVFFGLRLSS
jgi:hypothetical protein